MEGRDLDSDFNSLLSKEERTGSDLSEKRSSSFLSDCGFVIKEYSS